MTPDALTALALSGRYSRAGLAHAAADSVTEATGRPYEMQFRPRHARDAQPFTIQPAAVSALANKES